MMIASCGIFDSNDDIAPAKGFLAVGGEFLLFPGTATNLFHISDNGSEITQLTFDSLAYLDAKWSPDGRQIIAGAMFIRDNSFIYLFNSDGSGKELLHSSSLSPIWSPDGNRFAYLDGGDVYIYELQSGDTTHLGEGVGLEIPKGWSTEHGILVTGTRFTYTEEGYINSTIDEEIYKMDLNGNMTQLTSDSTLRKGFVSLSHDEDFIAYTAGPRFHIYILSLSDTTTRIITLEREFENTPIWSPDGSKLALRYVDKDSSTTDGIYLLDINTEELTLFYEYTEENIETYGHIYILDWR
ncbi:MAG: PD40 domain-containing protein [Candidatus Marinimicrobia bacterium]|nr:PD40 domain-containing protein [Candidatus Neomarinimicrobiota bacterium]